jgi:hypothetical protein
MGICGLLKWLFEGGISVDLLFWGVKVRQSLGVISQEGYKWWEALFYMVFGL